ncbi:MAG: Asp-tRNA(Asn)/Glu-tRNA(Gln) amidotransferase subunit GatA [Candidatus Omnitrophica bacterium]|nr:Asp-tRNA(Asn)/Glu-tRNA(Gln) amidotransferase subunit GatA [Candidatus Omnitrophota bacterium]
MDICFLTACELARKIRDEKLASADIFQSFSKRVLEYDKNINSFVECYDKPIYETKAGSSELCGVPIAIKNNICIEGREINCCSNILKGHVSAYDATVIKKIKSAGLNILGTTNMDEFAFGSSTETSAYGITCNPWDITRVPGGSSGGSAAAVAARLVPFALGSDTGGSIRQPASFCGVAGFKPSYGRVSRFGLVAFGSSLDQIGTLTRDFSDCADLLNIICGPDGFDATLADVKMPDFRQYLRKDFSGLTAGVPIEFFEEGINPQVKNAVEEAINLLKDNRVRIKPISLPHTKYSIATYYIIASSEASSNLQRFDGIRYGLRVASNNLDDIYKKTRQAGFGDEAKRRIFLGTYSLSSGYYDAYYMRALKVRRLIQEDFKNVFDDVDVIITPTSPTTAFKVGEKSDPLSMYLSDIYTISTNLAGLPAVSLPCGFDDQGLPIGMQFIGKSFHEGDIIRLGYSYQNLTEYNRKAPVLNYE